MSLQVVLRRPSSVLSNASLSLDDNFDNHIYGTRYRRHGFHILRMRQPRPDRMRVYSVVVIPPLKGWFPSALSNFVFGFQDKSPQWLIDLVPRYFNPSIWISNRHSDHFVLRVPKDRQEETWRRLYVKNLWYNGANNMWFRRRKRQRIE